MENKSNKDVDDTWQSSTRGEQAWKEARERVASRNADARKAGRSERETYERERDDARRTAAAERDAKLRKRAKR
jgi:hypothetical protein